MRSVVVSVLFIPALWVGTLAGPAGASQCQNTSVGLTPVNDLGTGLYLGLFEGGLYPGGSNAAPAGHSAEGISRALGMEPLDTNGLPSPTGKIVLLSIGMSNTSQEFCSASTRQPCTPWSFMGQAVADPRVNQSTMVLVNGARAGQAAAFWESPADQNYERIAVQELAPKGLTEAQVRAVWIKLANAGPTVSLPDESADAFLLAASVGNVVRAAKVRYPNLEMAFLSSRIYGGYAEPSMPINPEPYAYESGFAVKWLIQAQIDQMAGAGVDPLAGDLDYGTVAPLLAWGAYTWADGLTPRGDGLIWECGDLEQDGAHPGTSGEQKVGFMLLDFMLHSPFSTPWFRQDGGRGTGDCDDDGDVDLDDQISFAGCLAGPAELVPSACKCCDLDGDSRTDLRDFAAFLSEFDGVAGGGGG